MNDTWSTGANMPAAIAAFATAAVDTKIYIIGGANTGGPDYKPINLVQIFDPKTNQCHRSV